MCLESISNQDYPKHLIEVIFADGGSEDNTLNIINEFMNQEYDNGMRVYLFNNYLKTGEAGKAIAVKHASNEIVAFIDSDNILPTKDWLLRMIEPFGDSEIVGSEPIEYTYRKNDGYITRYCALIGMNDPLCLFLGNYDRYSTLTGQWTEVPHKEEDMGGYIKTELGKKFLPTIGANGFLVRRLALEKCNIGNYFFDIDIIYELLNSINPTNPNNPTMKIAKVKIGIIHLFSDKLSIFIKKQKRRVADYLYYNKIKLRKYPWNHIERTKIAKFCIFSILVYPLILQAIMGYHRKPDRAWYFHPIACILTLYIYAIKTLEGIFKQQVLLRDKWNQ